MIFNCRNDTRLIFKDYAEQATFRKLMIMQVCKIKRFTYNFMPKNQLFAGFCGIKRIILAIFGHEDGIDRDPFLYSLLGWFAKLVHSINFKFAETQILWYISIKQYAPAFHLP